MAGKSTYFADWVLEHIEDSAGSNWYIALYGVNPPTDVTGSGNELNGEGYTRMGPYNPALYFSNAANGQRVNTQDLISATAGFGGWDVSGWALHNAATGTRRYYWEEFASPIRIANGDNLIFPAGQLVLRED